MKNTDWVFETLSGQKDGAGAKQRDRDSSAFMHL